MVIYIINNKKTENIAHHSMCYLADINKHETILYLKIEMSLK